MPRARRPVVIAPRASGDTAVYLVTGAVAVGALVYLMREKGRAAPVNGLAWGGSWGGAISNAFNQASNAVSTAARQAADFAKTAAGQAAAAQKKAQEQVAQQAATAAFQARTASMQAELQARNAAQAAANTANDQARAAFKVQQAALEAGRVAAAQAAEAAAYAPQRLVSAPASVVNTLRDGASSVTGAAKDARGSVSDVVQGARNTAVQTLIVGALKLGLIHMPDAPPGEQTITDAVGNPQSHDETIRLIVEWFKEFGDADATSQMNAKGIAPGLINEGRAKWISMGSPRNGSSNPGPSVGPNSPGVSAADREALIIKMLGYFRGMGEDAAGALSKMGMSPADIAEARSRWIAAGSPRDAQPQAPQQPPQRSDDTGMTPTPPASDWKNPYSQYLNPQPGGGSSGGGGGSSGGGSSGGPSGGGSSGGGGASADVVNNMRAADAAAPKGKLNPVMVVGAAVAAPFVMHFMGGK